VTTGDLELTPILRTCEACVAQGDRVAAGEPNAASSMRVSGVLLPSCCAPPEERACISSTTCRRTPPRQQRHSRVNGGNSPLSCSSDTRLLEPMSGAPCRQQGSVSLLSEIRRGVGFSASQSGRFHSSGRGVVGALVGIASDVGGRADASRTAQTSERHGVFGADRLGPWTRTVLLRAEGVAERSAGSWRSPRLRGVANSARDASSVQAVASRCR
jgi:hypothetical protein